MSRGVPNSQGHKTSPHSEGPSGQRPVSRGVSQSQHPLGQSSDEWATQGMQCPQYWSPLWSHDGLSPLPHPCSNPSLPPLPEHTHPPSHPHTFTRPCLNGMWRPFIIIPQGTRHLSARGSPTLPLEILLPCSGSHLGLPLNSVPSHAEWSCLPTASRTQLDSKLRADGTRPDSPQ